MTKVSPAVALDGSLELDPHWTTKILSNFIRTELHRTGLRDLVLGLSGGIDSAVAVYLAARAIEPARIHACLLPYRTSSEDSLRDARSVVDDLGIDAETIEISPIVDGFETTAGKVDRLRLGNVMARARMTLLYDRSAAHRGLVLGTSNKTELLLGYGTLHGDLASALNPIGDLYKTQIRSLAEYLGVPESIRTKPPSADLWPDQNDEDDLGFRYEEVDRLLALLIDARVSRATAIEAGFSPELIDNVTRRIIGTQFKRKLSVIAKISTRSIGWDFRYPRDWMT
jgi:NAD+ synthase